MNVIDQLNVERQARGTAQSVRDEKRQAIVSKQETLGVRALGLADEIARQVPILAQAVTWAGGVDFGLPRGSGKRDHPS